MTDNPKAPQRFVTVNVDMARAPEPKRRKPYYLISEGETTLPVGEYCFIPDEAWAMRQEWKGPTLIVDIIKHLQNQQPGDMLYVFEAGTDRSISPSLVREGIPAGRILLRYVKIHVTVQ